MGAYTVSTRFSKKWFDGKRFTSNEEVFAQADTYFEVSSFLNTLKMLWRCWEKCILLKRAYVQK